MKAESMNFDNPREIHGAINRFCDPNERVWLREKYWLIRLSIAAIQKRALNQGEADEEI